MEGREARYYKFGDFKLDVRRRVLYKNQTRLDLSPRNFDLLYALIRHEGRVVSHDELLDTVWSGQFVEQSNLKKGISAIRHILEESPNESFFIKTVPRQGYAFVADVEAIYEETSSERQPAVFASHSEIIIEQTEELVENDIHERLPKAFPVAKPAVARRLVYLAVPIVLLLVGVATAWQLWTASSTEQRLGPVRIERLATDGECYGRLSADGNFIACAMKDEAGDSAIEIRQVSTDSRRRLISLPRSDIYAIQYSADASFIYYVIRNFADESKSGVHRISILGGEPKLLVRDAGSLAMGSDGRILFSRSRPEGGGDIMIADPNGAGERPVAGFDASYRIWDFRFSPGEKAITVSLRKQISDIKNVFYVVEIPLDGGAERILVPERETLIASAAWMPDGKSLLLCVREKNADIRQVWQYFLGTGEMVRVTHDNTSYKEVQVLKDGKTVTAVAEYVNTNIWVGDGDPFEFKPITGGVQSIDHAFWLRDGRLAYGAVENSAEVIRTMSEDGSSRERLTEGRDGYWIQPSLGGDGQSIAYNSNRSGLDQLWSISLDGRDARQLTRSEYPIFNGRMLSDGTVIYKLSVPGQGWALMQTMPDGTTARINIPDSNAWDISPDEKQIAHIRTDGKGSNVLVIYDRTTAAEQRRVELTAGPTIDRLKWNRDGRGFTYAATEKGVSEIYQVGSEGGLPQKLSNFRHDRVYSIDWSFDGRRLAVTRGRGFKDPVILRPS